MYNHNKSYKNKAGSKNLAPLGPAYNKMAPLMCILFKNQKRRSCGRILIFVLDSEVGDSAPYTTSAYDPGLLGLFASATPLK